MQYNPLPTSIFVLVHSFYVSSRGEAPHVSQISLTCEKTLSSEALDTWTSTTSLASIIGKFAKECSHWFAHCGQRDVYNKARECSCFLFSIHSTLMFDVPRTQAVAVRVLVVRQCYLYFQYHLIATIYSFTLSLSGLLVAPRGILAPNHLVLILRQKFIGSKCVIDCLIPGFQWCNFAMAQYEFNRNPASG